jgi:TatD DNase family protein
MLIDSHSHLDFPDFAPEVDAVVDRARAAGVRTMLTIGTRLRSFEGVRAVAERFDDVWCSVGVHPHEAQEEPLNEASALIERTDHPKVVGIGEAGLDYYYEHSPRDDQIRNFRAHIEAARATGLPLIVHTRDADDDMAAILSEEMAKGAFTGLLHCFSSSRELAVRAMALGFFISISGIVTFKKSDELRAIVADIPLDRLLVETDSPYLAPMPYRGKRNEPAFVVHTANAVATLKNVSPQQLADATSENFFRLFTKVKRPA